MIKLISGKMGGKLKEDEKNEKIIRGLLKLPANRKCINCNMLGPQYVCTTFSTFICTTCSGIHREFTHRVKSVSMAKFTPEEILYLQTGGNERAREILFKEWDPQQNFPDSKNVDKLRDFMKHVYVHRRYTGEKRSDKPPQVDKEEGNENKRQDPHCGSQSSPNIDTYQGRNNDRADPGYDVRKGEQHDKRHNDLRKTPVSSGVVNDWRREDRFSNGRKSVDHRSSVGDSKSEIKSPDNLKESDISAQHIVHPVTDLLGDNVVPLQIEYPKKNDSTGITDGLTFTQVAAPSSSLTPSNGNAAEVMKETSLIDFDTEPEPSLMSGQTQLHQSTASQSTSTQGDDNWDFLNNIREDSNGAVPNGSNLQVVPFLPTGSSNQGLTDSSVADKYGRKELPLDLFASTYVAGPYQAPGWQAGEGPGMGYPMQYNPAMSVPTFPHPNKPSNPFDANAKSTTAFPTVATTQLPSMHGALPNMQGPGGLPQSSSYPSTMPPIAQSYGLPMSGSYMGQQLPGNIAPSRPQGFGALGSEAATPFASLNMSSFGAPNPPVGGNPFD